MYPLEIISPLFRKIRIPFTRDQIMLLMIALNEILLGFETYSAHIISGTIVPNEWFPIVLGPVCGVILVFSILIQKRMARIASILATASLGLSLLVGLLGTWFHVQRAYLEFAPAGARLTVSMIIWSPPVFAPLTFCLISILGFFTIWPETPSDSGKLMFPGGRSVNIGLSKTRFYFLLVGMGILATLVSSVLDHARTPFTNPWLWVPTGVGVFAGVVTAALGFIRKPGRVDLLVFTAAMFLMILTGILGLYLHIRHDLTSQGMVVLERFIRGAPPLAPMLFADMGALGLIVLLDPEPNRLG